MTTGMERDDVRDTRTPRSKHRQRSYERMKALDVDDIPAASDDLAVDLRREVVVVPRGPRADTPDMHPLYVLEGRQCSAGIRRQDRDVRTARGHTTRDLVDVELDAPDVRQIARR